MEFLVTKYGDHQKGDMGCNTVTLRQGSIYSFTAHITSVVSYRKNTTRLGCFYARNSTIFVV